MTADPSVNVCGYLQRINVRKGFSHSFAFNREWWTLDSLTQTFAQYDRPDDEKSLTGEVPVVELKCDQVKRVERKGRGGRFDVILTNGQVYGFKAKDEIDRNRWVDGFGAILMADDQENIAQDTVPASLLLTNRENCLYSALVRLAGVPTESAPPLPKDDVGFARIISQLEKLARAKQASSS